MPATMNPSDALFPVGYLWGTSQGDTVNDRPFGELQEFQFDDGLELAKLFGPSSLGAIGVGVQRRNITGRARWAKIRARQFNMLRGSSAAHSGGFTTITMGVTDHPVLFNLHFKAPANGVDCEIKVYGCIAPSLSVPLTTRDWTIPDFAFEVNGDGTKFAEIILPGNQTTS